MPFEEVLLSGNYFERRGGPALRTQLSGEPEGMGTLEGVFRSPGGGLAIGGTGVGPAGGGSSDGGGEVKGVPGVREGGKGRNTEEGEEESFYHNPKFCCKV